MSLKLLFNECSADFGFSSEILTEHPPNDRMPHRVRLEGVRRPVICLLGENGSSRVKANRDQATSRQSNQSATLSGSYRHSRPIRYAGMRPARVHSRSVTGCTLISSHSSAEVKAVLRQRRCLTMFTLLCYRVWTKNANSHPVPPNGSPLHHRSGCN
jgi:hypothetical protein